MVKIQIWRSGLGDVPAGFKEYEVPWEPKETVLGSLMYIYDHLDDSLAFRYGCRYKDCGLCAARVSGRDRLTCTTHLQDGDRVEPLRNLPLIRDLVVDRRPVAAAIRAVGLYPQPSGDGGITGSQEHYTRLAWCVDCLACHSMCPHVRYPLADPQEGGFPGPYLFVKLAQAQAHPANREDRLPDAARLGVERCLSCRDCGCPYGVNLQRDVFRFLARGKSWENEAREPAGSNR